MTRRRVVQGLGAMLASYGLSSACKPNAAQGQSHQIEYESRDFNVVGTASLKERAAAKGLIYGSAGRYSALPVDAEYAERFAEECGMLVPEGELKWKALRPTPDQFDFTKGDWLLEFAQRHQMLMRGHTLVWHKALPNWFERVVNQQNAEQYLTEHISTVVSHYAGKLHSWDVVNEVIHAEDGRADGLKRSPWLNFLGTDYIELAFRTAAAADPQTMLVLNENKLHSNEFQAHRDALLELLRDLISKGTPIHAVGMQGHLWASAWDDARAEGLSQFMSDIASLGLKLLVTEMDVLDSQMPASIDIRDRMVASVYQEYLSVVLSQPAVVAVMTWGLSDRYTWLQNYKPREDGLASRSLPLDADLNPKLAWNAIAQAFDQAPSRAA